jgi:hypothetical protein
VSRGGGDRVRRPAAGKPGSRLAETLQEGAAGRAPLDTRVLALQRQAGNRAVDHLLEGRRSCACGGHAKGGKPCAKCSGLGPRRRS